MKTIAFEPHLASINSAYKYYFKENRNLKFIILKKPRWKDKKTLNIIYMIIFSIKTFKDLLKKKYDLIHINGINFGIIAYLASFFGCKYIFTIHGCPHLDIEKKEGGLRILFAYMNHLFTPIVAKRALKVYTISRFSQKELLDKYKIRSTVIYNGFDRNKMIVKKSEELLKKYNLSNKVICISVGRMIEYKKPFRVIDVFENIRKYFNNGHLVFIGEGILKKDVEEYVKNKGLKDSVTFIEKVSFDDICKWYSNSKYFISGADLEGFGLAALEAVSCGCIPILPNKGAFPELFIDKKYLYDIDKINNIRPIELTETDKIYLNKVLNDLTWEKSISKYEKIYKNLLG